MSRSILKSPQARTPKDSADLKISLRLKLCSMASRILPHDSTRTTCPPAPLRSGLGQTIIVSSLMRSGTHLLMDSLLNNFPGFRRLPLFLDFDAYARKELPVSPLYSLSGVLIKTHYPETPLSEPYAKALIEIAARSIVLNPIRNADEVRNSLSKWGVHFTHSEYAEVERSFYGFWATFSPVVVEFSHLLNPEGIASVLSRVSVVSGLTPLRVSNPVVPASTRVGVYIDKLITRVVGGYAPRINTTIGFQLRQKRICDSEHLRSWRDS